MCTYKNMCADKVKQYIGTQLALDSNRPLLMLLHLLDLKLSKCSCMLGAIMICGLGSFFFTGPGSALGNVSGYRCVSYCNPGVASSIPARSHTFVEIDHEIISTVILRPSTDSFKKGCCQLQAKVCARITGYPLVQACPGKSVVR